MELARRSAREAGVQNVRFFQGDVKKTCESLIAEGERFDLLLADPPRTGAPGLAEWAEKLGVTTVVYVACDPVALAKDAKALLGKGFRAESVQVVDMFPQTRHVEAVMKFVKP
jgi:23S rRNA (uracil1939-C5)-methyltransferase